MLLVALVCALPVALSYLAFYFWQPAGRTNYGELIPLVPLAELQLQQPGGDVLAMSRFRGRWVLLSSDSRDCSDACRSKLWLMRQVRLALGKNQHKVERLWLLDGPGVPAAALVNEHAGIHLALDPQGKLHHALAAGAVPREHVYLIDPYGNLMMRFPPNAEPKRVLKDLRRLITAQGAG